MASMNRVKSTLLRSSGMRKMLIRVLNMGRCLFNQGYAGATTQASRDRYSCLGGASSAAGAAAAGAPAGAAGTASSVTTFLGAFSRGTNFFLGLGNSKASPLRFCAAPPTLVIASWADLLYQPATTVSFLLS